MKRVTKDIGSQLNWFVDFWDKKRGESLKGRIVELHLNGFRMEISVDNEVICENNLVEAFFGEIPSENYFKREIEAVQNLNNQGYNVKYFGPRSLQDYLMGREINSIVLQKEFPSQEHIELAVEEVCNKYGMNVEEFLELSNVPVS